MNIITLITSCICLYNNLLYNSYNLAGLLPLSYYLRQTSQTMAQHLGHKYTFTALNDRTNPLIIRTVTRVNEAYVATAVEHSYPHIHYILNSGKGK